MKRISSVIAVLFIIGILIAALAGCNMGLVGHFNFSNCAVKALNGNCMHYTLNKWYDSESAGIEISTKENGDMFLSEGTYALYTDKCPFCGE